MPTLTPGTRLGPYEVVAAIGAGGMGEVYRAKDTKLNRDVAIKVLPEIFADDTERLARFTREAQTLASLNHPNIAAIYGIEESGSTRALVMELVEGDDLSVLIARGPMPAADAVPITKQIAEALEAAHELGIVHRDLKPANIKIRGDGTVKVLDFGLAKAMDVGPGGAGRPGGLSMNSPTLSIHATQAGIILGTAAYMAPEQARGKAVDKRADVWAFGVVLYEMLSGRAAFAGETITDIIAAVVTREPDWTAVPAATPASIRQLLTRCLDKDPKRRLRDIGEARFALESSQGSATVEETATRQSSTRAGILSVAAALAAGAAIAAAAVAWILWPKAPAPPVVSRFAIALPEGQAFTRTGRHIVALSPDGTRLVYVANQQLYLRAMHELTAAPISGTENSDPSEPIFSPDGQWVAFWSGNQLRKVPTTGGTPVTLSAANNPLGASWAGDRILLGQLDPLGIVAVPANGGAATSLVTVNAKNAEQAYGPQLVGGGQAVLFTLRTGEGAWDDATIVVHDLKTGRRTVLVNGGTDGHVLPTGHLVYSRDGTLFAVPFDETRLTVTGGPVPVQQGIGGATGGPGATQAAWSVSGSLVFVLGGTSRYFDRALVWIDRQGKEERAAAPLRPYGFQYEAAPVKVSPDGTRIALTVVPDSVRSTPAARQSSASGPDIWVLDIARGALTRLTFTGAATVPIWMRDSRRVCYVSSGIKRAAFCQAADGTGQPQTLLTANGLVAVSSFSPDGSRALVTLTSGKTGTDIMIATMGSSPDVRPLIATPYDESYGTVSPDGRWLAYQSNESGRLEIYVRPFPDVEKGRWQVSTDGAVEPRWSSNGRELFFFNGISAGGSRPLGALTSTTALMSVAIQAGSGFVAGAPKTVVKWPSAAGSAYDVAPDGRFLVNVPALSATTESTGRPQMVIVQHWFDELKARVPIK